jgi:hypothetical protein
MQIVCAGAKGRWKIMVNDSFLFSSPSTPFGDEAVCQQLARRPNVKQGYFDTAME